MVDFKNINICGCFQPETVKNMKLISSLFILYIAVFMISVSYYLVSCPRIMTQFTENPNEDMNAVIYIVLTLTASISTVLSAFSISRNLIASKYFLCVGLFISGFNTIAVSFIYKLDSGKVDEENSTLYVVLCVLQEIGTASALTSSLTLICGKCRSSIGTYLSLLGFVYCLSAKLAVYWDKTITPVVQSLGGALICGFTYASFGLLCLAIFRGRRSSTKFKLSLWNILRIRRVLINVILLIFSTLLLAFNEATLHNKGMDDHDQIVVVTLMFLTSTPLWGLLSDCTRRPRLFCVLGTMSCATGFFLSSDATSKEIITIAQISLGLAVGLIFIPAFSDIVRFLISNHIYPDSAVTYGLLSGIFVLALNLGYGLGAGVGFILSKYIGYEDATLFASGLSCVMAMIAFLADFRVGKIEASSESSLSDQEDSL